MNQTNPTGRAGEPRSRMDGLWPDETGTTGHPGRSRSASDAPAGLDEHPATGSASDSAEPYSRYLAELAEYAGHYLAVQKDRMGSQVFSIALTVLAAMVAGVLGLAILITAAVQFMLGIAAGLEQLLGEYAWAGNVITGLVTMVVAFLVLWLVKRHSINKHHRGLKEKYDRRQAHQRSEFGRSAADRVGAVERTTAAANGNGHEHA